MTAETLRLTTAEVSDAGLVAATAAFTALSMFVLQLIILLLTLTFVGLGLVAVTRWLWREVWHSLEHAGTALARALPLLVIISIFAFWTAELWQSVGRLRWPGTIGVIALFTIIGGSFILRAQTDDLRNLATFADRDQLKFWLKDTPLKRAVLPATMPLECELSSKQRRSAKFVMTVSKLVLSSVIGLFTACFFVVLGFITISQADVAAFSTSNPEVLWGFTLDERRFVISWQLIRVAGFMGIFSAFYFAVVSATDEQLREHMLEAAEDGVRQACAARLVILHSPELDSDDVDDAPVKPGPAPAHPTPAPPVQ